MTGHYVATVLNEAQLENEIVNIRTPEHICSLIFFTAVTTYESKMSTDNGAALRRCSLQYDYDA